MPSPSKYSVSKTINSIMTHLCLKLIECNEWEKALAIYKLNSKLNLNITNNRCKTLIEILLTPSPPELRKEEHFKSEMLKIFISSIQPYSDNIDYSVFLIKKDFYFFHEYLNARSIPRIQLNERYLFDVTQEIISYYKSLKNLGFNPVNSLVMEKGEPINFLEECFLNGLYLPSIALCTVYPEIFCSPDKLIKLNSWIKELSLDPNCVLHQSFSKNREFARNNNNEIFKYTKKHFDMAHQKMEFVSAYSLQQ